MKDKLEYIIENLKESFNGKPWYGISMLEKLNQIPWEIVNEQNYSSKSIAVLVQHIINWRIFVLKKLAGDSVYNIVIDGENDWDKVHIESEEEWKSLIAKLQNTQHQLLEVLGNKSDSLLKEQVPGKEYVFGPILTSIAQHDIYHLGQIGMLNAMRKS